MVSRDGVEAFDHCFEESMQTQCLGPSCPQGGRERGREGGLGGGRQDLKLAKDIYV